MQFVSKGACPILHFSSFLKLRHPGPILSSSRHLRGPLGPIRRTAGSPRENNKESEVADEQGTPLMFKSERLIAHVISREKSHFEKTET
jgi:hypothetical protein